MVASPREHPHHLNIWTQLVGPGRWGVVRGPSNKLLDERKYWNVLENKIYLTPSASNETRQKILLQNIINNKIFCLLLFQKKLLQIFTMLGSLSGLGSNAISAIKDTWARLYCTALHWEVNSPAPAPGSLTIRQCPSWMQIFCHVIPLPPHQARITEIFTGPALWINQEFLLSIKVGKYFSFYS